MKWRDLGGGMWRSGEYTIEHEIGSGANGATVSTFAATGPGLGDESRNYESFRTFDGAKARCEEAAWLAAVAALDAEVSP